jgi:hypothetical protein
MPAERLRAPRPDPGFAEAPWSRMPAAAPSGHGKNGHQTVIKDRGGVG